jgi:regulator of replication initiation timing
MGSMDRVSVDEIKRHFEVVAEGVRAEVQAVAEGVESLAERIGSLDTRVGGLQQEVRHEFTETQAIIRLSYSELDRRLRDLETDVGHLRVRLERLEAGT